MKFEDAVKEIKSMFPANTHFNIGFEYTLDSLGAEVFICRAIAIPPGSSSPSERLISYWKTTWQEVIDAFKIHFLPKGVGSLDEAPDEAHLAINCRSFENG